jgi:hypothetical protein
VDQVNVSDFGEMNQKHQKALGEASGGGLGSGLEIDVG